METPVQDTAPEVKPSDVKESVAAGAPAPSPAQDLRDVQSLLVMGIFPGNMAPQVVKAYQLLEAMARQVEQNDTKK